MKKILVIDDEPSIRETLQRLLKAQDYDVACAEDGFAGLEKARAWIPHLIVLDVLMPKMDGFSLCAILKKDPKTSHIPVLILSTLGKMGDAEEAIKQGATAYMTKPYDFARFLEKIKTLLLG
jgi:CheY-like chemotaxis protein